MDIITSILQVRKLSLREVKTLSTKVLQLLFEKKQGSLFQNVPVAFVDGYSCQTDTAYAVASKMSLKK